MNIICENENIINMPVSEDDKNKAQWNEKLEYAVKEIGETSKGYKLMHIIEAQNTIRTYNVLMLFGIILGPLSGLISGIDTAINATNDTDPTLSIISIVCAMMAGIITAIVKFGKYDEASNANKQAAARYTSIESNVRRQLGLYRKDRVQALPYIEWLETKFEELFLSAPLLPPRAYDKYSKTAKILGLSVPNQYDAIININTEYESIKINELINQKNIQVSKEKYSEENQPEEQKMIIYDNNDDNNKLETTISSNNISEEKKIKRSVTMLQFPQLNQYSDKMLEYEMKRLMGFADK